MKLTGYLHLPLTLCLWAAFAATICCASPGSPKLPSTYNFQSLNEVAVPTTEADWSFEMSHLDLAIASDHISGLRARNSDIYLLQYMLFHTVLTTDTTELNALSSYATANGYDPESAFLHYYDDTTANYSNGTFEVIKGYGGGTAATLKDARVKNYIWTSARYVYNLKSPLFRKFKGYYYRQQITSGYKPDGIFVDEVSPASAYFPSTSSGGHVIEYGNRTETDFATDYLNDMVPAFADVNTALGSDHPTYPGGDRVILPNIAEYVSTFMNLGTQGTDGLLTEFWIQVKQPRVPEAYDEAKQLADAGKILIFSQGSYDPEVDALGNYSSAADRHQMYSLTNYWIARQGRFTYYQQKAPNGSSLLSQFWCKARDFDVGQPIDPLYSTWQTGTDSAGQSYTIYKRTYTKALMLSRPQAGWPATPNYSTPSQTYDLGGTYRLLHYDGTLGPDITKIALCMGEAVTLIGSSNGTTAPDGTPPTISGVATSGITSSSATIAWTTDEAATGSVDYGTTTSYGITAALSNSATSQSVTLTGLTAGTIYHYRITAVDTSGNRAITGDYSFTTASSGGGGGGTTTGAPFIKHWAMIGSFAYPSGGSGHNIDYIGEATIQPSIGTVTAGKTWTDYTSPNDQMDFYSLFSPNTNCAAYLNTYVYSPTQQNCQLRLGVDDAAKAYLNGILVDDNPGYRSANADTDIVNVVLKQGWNQLLCKTENFSVGWTMYVRLTDSQGNQVPNLVYQVNSQTAPPSGTTNLAITITADKTSARVGDTIKYTVSYINTGAGQATNVVISANVDPHVSFVSASNGGTYNSTSGKVSWNIGNVAPNGSGTLTFTVVVK